MGKSLTVTEAWNIAEAASSLVGYGTCNAGDACVYEYDDNEFVTAYIHKDKNDGKDYYTVVISDDRYDGGIYHTETLKTSDLANLLYEISQCCIKQEKYPRTKPEKEHFAYAVSA